MGTLQGSATLRLYFVRIPSFIYKLDGVQERCLGILLQPQPSLREGNQKPMENRPWESGRSGNFFPFPRKKMAGHINSAMLSNWTQHCLVYSATLAHCLCREFVVEHSEVVYIVE